MAGESIIFGYSRPMATRLASMCPFVSICQVQANKTPPKRQTEDGRDDVAKKRKAEAKAKAGGAVASAKKSSGKHKAAADNIQDEV